MLAQIKEQFIGLVRDEEGASMVEYILLIAVIAAVAIVGFRVLGTTTRDTANNTAATVRNPTGN
jgi:Flp pilus assembly pilin Flp